MAGKSYAFLGAAIILAGTAFAGPAMVESKETVAPGPVVETCDWTGFYVGAALGVGWNSYDVSGYDVLVDQNPIVNGPLTFAVPGRAFGDDANFIGGGQLGYNRQFGHFVLGLEGDFQSNNDEHTNTFTPPSITRTVSFGNFVESSTTDLVSVRRFETNWLGSARGRVGFAAGCFMVYGTGGVAFTSIDARAYDTANSSLFFNGVFIFNQTDANNARDHDRRVGWTAGGGIEYMVRRWLSLGVEYRHADFGSDKHHFESSTGGNVQPADMNIDLENDQVTFRVNWLLH